MKRILLASIAVVVLGISASAADRREGSSGIQAEKTTKAEVKKLCGEPASSKGSAAGEEWRYLYGDTDSLVVSFDKAGVVKDYRYQTAKAMPRKGKGGFKALAGEKPGTVHCDLCPIYCTRTVCDLNGCRDEEYICQWYSCNCRGD